MNYRITFSTYVNSTGTTTPKTKMLKDLIELANIQQIQGWSLTDQTGCYAGELELSHAMTLFDVEPAQAETLALAIKGHFQQLEVILEHLPDTEVRFI